MKRITAVLAAVALTLFTMAVVASDARAETVTEPVGTAGSVTFSTDGGVIAFVDASVADGWDYSIVRQDDTHLKVVFRSGDGQEAEFEAELEGGQLVIGSGGESTSSTASDVTVTTEADSDSTTSTTSDDSARSPDSDGQFDDRPDDQSDDHGGDDSRSIDDDDDQGDDDDDQSGRDSDDSDHSSGDDGDSDDSDHSSGDDGSTTSTTAAEGDQFSEPTLLTTPVADAGTVTVVFVDGEVVFSDATIADGWSYTVDHTGGSHVEVEFHGEGTEIDFRIDADGRIRIEQDS